MSQEQMKGVLMEATEVKLLMRHIHEHGFHENGCTWQIAKQRGDRAIRGMGSKKFAEAVKQLVSLGYGDVKVDKPLTYCSHSVVSSQAW